MRPITRNNPGYVIPPTVQIRKQSTRTLLKNEGIGPNTGTKATFSMPVLLQYLSNKTFANNGADKWGNLTKDQAMLVNQLISIFSSSDTVGYGNARGALIRNFGELCDYCEMIVQDSSLAVEHILPKAQFPGDMLTYDNFFLACPVCNSVKGSKPTYATSRNWAIKQQGIPFPNYNQVQGGGLNYAIWPTWAEAYTGFSNDLYLGNGTLISRQNSINTNNTYVSSTDNEVRANINGLFGTVVVQSLFTSVGANVAKLQRDNLLALVGLNKRETGEFADRRVTNRTIAWLQALAAGKRLNLVFQNDQTPTKAFYILILEQVVETVRSAGYFSTWAFIFYVLSPPLNNQWSYYTFLRTNATNAGQPQYYIPGTNAAGLPVN
jgi:hypothetical protein